MLKEVGFKRGAEFLYFSFSEKGMTSQLSLGSSDLETAWS